IIYLNNILIYSYIYSEYSEYIYYISQKLYKAGFYIKFLKYKFTVLETKFLNLIINYNKFRIDLKKIKTVA
ncbi:uncharacterized protein BO95DRAFT_377230, partial [Aspergillus brunneoviolaceus CBS 621.78]